MTIGPSLRDDAWARAGRIGAAALALLGLCVVTLGAVLELDESYRPTDEVVHSLPDLCIAGSFAVVGGVLLLKRPANLVGWALSLSGGGMLLGGVLSGYAELALLAKPELGLPWGAALGQVAVGSWTPLIAGVFLLLVLFPNGALPSPRWRFVARAVPIGLAAAWVLITFSPGKLDPPLDGYSNPLAVSDSALPTVLAFVVIAPCLAATLAAALNLVLRFRRSRGAERQQYKWLAGAAGFLFLTFPFAGIFNYSGLAGGVVTVALISLPVSVGVAVLRYRLYDIDVLVRRTLVYAVLTGALAALYLGVVIALQAAFSAFAGGSDLAIAGSTLVVAALFRPARGRVQDFVDRRFYRRKYDSQRTVAAFSSRLRDEVDLEALSGELRQVVAETVQPQHVSLWLRESP